MKEVVSNNNVVLLFSVYKGFQPGSLNLFLVSLGGEGPLNVGNILFLNSNMNIITAHFSNLHQSYGLLDLDIPGENPIL